jgi:hypothetical protein
LYDPVRMGRNLIWASEKCRSGNLQANTSSFNGWE